MGFTADKVIVELEAKIDRYNANVNASAANFDRRLSSMERTASRAERSITGSFRNIAQAAGVGLSVAGLLAAARGFLAIADQAKNLEAQLRLATRESGNFAQAQTDVRRIAAETRSGLVATANLYAAFSRSSRELGITQADVARITQTVSESFRVSGASAADSAQATRQLVQAFQSGVLRGDEFNSMAENAPRLQRLLAQSLGVTTGELRAMAEAGQLTAAKLATAFTDRRFTAGLDEEFRSLPVTFEQAMTLVENAAIQTFGAFDQGGEFSQAIANFFSQSAQGFSGMESDATNAGITVRSTMEGLGDVFGPLMDGASDAFSFIRSLAVDTQADIRAIFGALDSAAAGLRSLTVSAGTFVLGNGPVARRYLETNLPDATPVVPRFDAAVTRSDNRLRTNAASRRAGLRTVGGRDLPGNEFQRFLNDPSGHDFFGREVHPLRARPAAATGGHGGGRHPRSTADADARREQQETGRFNADLAGLNQDLLAARQAQVTAAEAIAAFEVQQIEVERDRQNQHYRDQAELTRGDKTVARARAQQLIEVNNAVAAERIRTVALREQDRIAQEAVDVAKAGLDNEIEMERARGALAETRSAQRDSELTILDLTTQQERLELEALIASRTATDAQKEIARARLGLLDAIKNERTLAILRAHESPGQTFTRGLNRNAEQLNDDFERVATSGLQSLNDGLAEAIANGDSLGKVFHRVANQIIADILRIAIQQTIIKPLANQLFGPGGGGGGFLSSLSSLFQGGGGGGGFDFLSAASKLAPGAFAIGGKPPVGRPSLVGERGPELFIPGASGSIVPNNRLASMGAAEGGVARVLIELSGDIDGRIASVSGPVAVEVFRAGAPQIIQAAKAETIGAAYRRRLNG